MSSKFEAVKETMLTRHSVRKYIPFEMPQEDLEEILTLANSAPSAWNLQHWRYLIFRSEEAKQQLLPIAYNQSQVMEASVVVAVLGDLQANKSARDVFRPAVEKGWMTQEVYDTLIGQINETYQNSQVVRDEAFLNASLASMQLMLAAKAKGYETCPMTGFNKGKLVEEFHISDRFVPVMLISVGKPTVEAHPSARFDLDQVILETL